MSRPPQSAEARVHYHQRSPSRQAYHIDADGVNGRLLSPEHELVDIRLHDVRDPAHATDLDADGVCFLTAPSAVRDFTGESWKPSYEAEIKALLRARVGASDVLVFDHTLRVDDPNAERRPARNVHTDYSADGARARLDDLLGIEEAARWAGGRYAFLNVWRPVGGVVRTAPLAFVRPRTVRPSDWVLLDLIYPDRVGQILGLVANPAHEWLYQSEMRPDEVVVFNIFDSGRWPAVAHSAVDLLPPGVGLRRSLETRTLVRF